MINYSSKKENALNRIKTTKNKAMKTNTEIPTYKKHEYVVIPLLRGSHITLEKRNMTKETKPKYISIHDILRKYKNNIIEALEKRIKSCENDLLEALDNDNILSIDSRTIIFNKSDRTWGFNIDTHIIMLNLLEKIKHDIVYLQSCTGKEAYQMMKALHYHRTIYPEEILALLLIKIKEGE